VSEVLRVTCADFDQVAVIAGNMMHFKHFGAVRKGSRDILVGRGIVAADRDERQESEAQSFRVHLSSVAADHTSSFELANPLENRRGGQTDRTGDVNLCFAGIRLELIQDLEIDGIEVSL